MTLNHPQTHNSRQPGATRNPLNPAEPTPDGRIATIDTATIGTIG
jgi:hypothetical protein